MFILRFALIFIVLAFAGFFFWKTLLTTDYFKNRQRLLKIARNVILIGLSLITAWLIILIFLESR